MNEIVFPKNGNTCYFYKIKKKNSLDNQISRIRIQNLSEPNLSVVVKEL